MAKLSEKYEALIVLNTKAGEEGVKALVEKIQKLISSNATLDAVDEWGKRRLAYPINDQTEGYYVQFDFTSKTDFPQELDRVLGITEGVLRYLVVLAIEKNSKAQAEPAAAAEEKGE